MLEEIIIKKTSNPDDGYDDEDELFMDTLTHRDDVRAMMYNIASHIEDIGDSHDWTKLEFFDGFAKDALERKDTPDFKERDWYNIHTFKERHHINANVPDDVNLFDVIEMICDCVCAGKSRCGEVNLKYLILDDAVLNDAYWNTVKLVCDKIILDEEK